MSDLVGMITAQEPDRRTQSLEALCSRLSLNELLRECAALDSFRRRSDNLYERVRALFFLYAIHRFHLPPALDHGSPSTLHTPRTLIPFRAYELLLQRRFEEAIDQLLITQQARGPGEAISSALAAAYHRLGF